VEALIGEECQQIMQRALNLEPKGPQEPPENTKEEKN